MDRLSRASGAFLGLAVGDVLGTPVEGLDPGEIEQRFGRINGILDPFEIWRDQPGRTRLRGLHTDDTQQAWILAGVLGDCGEILVDEVARRYRDFGRPRAGLPDGIHRGIGPGFRSVLERLRGNDPPPRCAAPSAGNGAAARIAPVAIRAAGSIGPAVPGLVLASAMTHEDPRAIEAAGALAGLVAALAGDDPPGDARDGVEAAIEGARKVAECLKRRHPVRIEPDLEKHLGTLAPALRELARYLNTETTEVLRQIVRIGLDLGPRQRLRSATEGFGPSSVLAAIALALMGPSFEEVLLETVNAGGDSGSVTAMAGAVAGARFGSGAIPPAWLETLVLRDALDRVARHLAGDPGTRPPEQEHLEEEWTLREHELRLDLSR